MPPANPDHARAIGEKLRSVRAQRQMSLRDLAEKTEVSASMLSQIETGKAFPSVRSIYTIAAALGVPVDYFFPDSDREPSPLVLDPPAGDTHSLTASEMRESLLTGQRPPDTAAVEAPRATPVMPAAVRPTIELRGGVTWQRLTALAEAGAEFLEINYAPGATSGLNLSHHAGREFGLVLEGQLVVELGFDNHTLQPGDSIIFDSTTPHRLTNQGAAPMRALWVVLNQ
jgi:transcriptional regulator with XRE-family HTH domain/uncharacterized cupin superfamily protein